MRSLVGDLVLVRLQEERDPLLHKRLYNALRRAILDGSLAPQSRLPPSRDLAGELGVSRNTILTTYEQLLAEGYVVSRRGSGTFVAQTAPESSLTAKRSARKQQYRGTDGASFTPRPTSARPGQRQPAPVGGVYTRRAGR